MDLNEWKCNSVYWPGPGLEIMRGTWFHDTSWQPVDCEHADRIEAEHIKRFMGHKMADYIWDPTNQCRREVMVSLEEENVSWELLFTCCHFYFRFNIRFSWRL